MQTNDYDDKEISDQEICRIIAGHEELIAYYNKRFYELTRVRRLADKSMDDIVKIEAKLLAEIQSECIRAASFYSAPNDRIQLSGRRNLHDIFVNSKMLEEQDIRSICRELSYITERRSLVIRIYLAYEHLDPELHDCLQMMYEEKETDSKGSSSEPKSLYYLRRKALKAIRSRL